MGTGNRWTRVTTVQAGQDRDRGKESEGAKFRPQHLRVPPWIICEQLSLPNI